MKNYLNLSESFIKQLVLALKVMIEDLLNSEFTFSRKQIMTEAEVADLLHVSERTMRHYRAEKLFHYIKLEGRVYYLSIIFYFDLVVHCLKSRL